EAHRHVRQGSVVRDAVGGRVAGKSERRRDQTRGVAESRISEAEQRGADVEEIRVDLLHAVVGVDVEPFPGMGDKARHRAPSPHPARSTPSGPMGTSGGVPAAWRPTPRPYRPLAVKSRYFGIRGSNTEPPTPAPNVVLLSAVPTMAVEPATQGPRTHLRVLSLK